MTDVAAIEPLALDLDNGAHTLQVEVRSDPPDDWIPPPSRSKPHLLALCRHAADPRPTDPTSVARMRTGS